MSKSVVFEGSILDFSELVLLGALSNVSVVVSNHFVEECLGLVSGSNLHAEVLNDLNDSHALLVKLFFDLALVTLKSIIEFRVFWVLLDGADGSDGSSL